MLKMVKILLTASVLFSSWVWADNEGARNTVVSVVDAFRTSIVADKDELVKNPALLNERVDKILATVVDFDAFAKKIMGKYYRRATSEQIQRFSTVTKDTLINTYGSSLLQLDPNKITVLPLGPQGTGKEVKVDVSFQMDSGSPLDISFYMEDYGNNSWKLSNVVISNINFGLTFRKQFAVMMQQNSNDISLAIDAWRESLAKKS